MNRRSGNLSRRAFIGGTAALGVTMPRIWRAPSPSSKTTLTIWNGDSRPAWVSALNVFVNAYEKSHPDVRATIVEVPSPDLDTKLRAAIRGGGVPDLVYTFRGYMVDWAAAGLTQPLDSLYTSSIRSDLRPNVLKSGTYKGKVYFVPNVQLQQIIYYRKDWFQQGGLKPPATWNDIIEAARTLNQPPTHYGFLLYDEPPEEVFPTDIMTAFGANIFDRKGKVIINSHGTVNALQTAAKLVPYSPPGSLAKNQTDQRAAFANGLAAMFMASSSSLGAVADAGIANNVGVVPIPTSGSTQTPSELYGFALPKKASNVSGAKGLLREMLNRNVYESASGSFVTGMLPVFSSAVRANSPFWASPSVKPYTSNVQAALQASKNGVAAAERYGYSPYYNAIRASGVLNKMVSDVLANHVPPAKAAAAAASSIQQTIAVQGGS